jgi:hypothetical protein
VSLARIACLGLALAAAPAGAASVPFGDSVRYWAGYANGTSDDAKDTIGHPDVTGGAAGFAGGQLVSVRIDYTGPFSLAAPGQNGSVIPGDLFLDAGADGDWDYVIEVVSGPQSPASFEKLSILDVADLAPSYLLSGSDGSGHWQGYGIRDRHPYAWSGGGTAVGVASLVADGLLAGGSHSLLFSLGQGLDLGTSFVIAFAPSCANDVIFERVNAPVPEPGAALLFGAGALWVARRGRRAASR